jgi:hypothetical protein
MIVGLVSWCIALSFRVRNWRGHIGHTCAMSDTPQSQNDNPTCVIMGSHSASPGIVAPNGPCLSSENSIVDRRGKGGLRLL